MIDEIEDLVMQVARENCHRIASTIKDEVVEQIVYATLDLSGFDGNYHAILEIIKKRIECQ